MLGKSSVIFVTVGTHFKGFDRLVSAVDEVAEGLDDKVIMQIGAGEYVPKNSSSYFRNAPYREVKALIEEARIIICHAGSGSLLDCLSAGKVPIVVPRLAQFGEARDNHQLELARFLEDSGSAIVVNEIGRLRSAIDEYETEKEASLLIRQNSQGRRERKASLPIILRAYVYALAETRKTENKDPRA